MRPLKAFLKAIAVALTAGPWGQRVLRRLVIAAQWLQGIASGSHVAQSGERVVFEVLKRRGKPPFVIFDVGANRGQFLVIALDALQDCDTTIHCFEPGAATFEMLTRNREALGNVSFNNVAVGRESGEAVLWYDTEGSGIASLTRRDLTHVGVSFEKSEAVRTITLDAYASEKGIEWIDLLKLDIEGHELDALAGAEGLLRRGAIGMLMFEFGGCNIDTRTFFRDYWRVLVEAGMETFRITPGGYLFPVRAYEESLEQFRTTNFLALSGASGERKRSSS